MKPDQEGPNPQPKPLPVLMRRETGQSYEVRDQGKMRVVDLSYHAIKSGVPATIVRDLQSMSVLEKEDVRSVISLRTLERRVGNKESLRPEEADGVARILRVMSHAYRVFEDEELAEEWLRCPNPALNDEVPMTMAATDVGAREVEGVLTRLEHGIFD